MIETQKEIFETTTTAAANKNNIEPFVPFLQRTVVRLSQSLSIARLVLNLIAVATSLR